MACLILSLIISVLLALFLLTTSGSIALSGEDFLRILGILLTSAIYLSTFYLIGLLISTVSRRTATALILVMFVWVMLVLVYPSLTVATLDRLISIEEKLKIALSEIEQFWDRYDSDERASCKKNSVRSYSYPARIGHGNHTKYSGGYNNQTCFIIDLGGHMIMIKLTKIKKSWSRMCNPIVSSWNHPEFAPRKRHGWFEEKRSIRPTAAKRMLCKWRSVFRQRQLMIW